MATPGRRILGIKRLSGVMLVSGLTYALQALSRSMFGVDDDEEQAIRDLAAPWNKNSNLFFTGRDAQGNMTYLDLSYLDAYNYWKRPINAILQDQPWEESAKTAARDMIEPFLGSDIVATAIYEILANKKSSGGYVFRENDTLDSQAADIANHLRKAIQPGAASNMERMWKAVQGQHSPSGKLYKIDDELIALGGWRVTTIDPRTSLYYRSFEFKDGLSDATSGFYRTIRSQDDVSDAKIFEEYSRALKLRQRSYDEFRRLINAARKSGLDDLKIRTILKSSRVSKKDTEILLRNADIQWFPSEATIKADIQKAAALDRDNANTLRKRYAILKRNMRGAQ